MQKSIPMKRQDLTVKYLISSDGRAWSVGVDGGRKDGREFKLTQGEHLVRVTHESLKQRFVSCISAVSGVV